MANRTTVKSNIVTQNVPTVTNAILTGMLNTELADNVRFREDVAVVQNSGVSPITVDFTGKDRVDLTRTGGSLAITVTGMGDGETKFLLITKTAGQSVTWVGVTDVTPVKTNADALSLVLYEIVRKGSYYFAKAWVESVVQATDSVLGLLAIATSAEHNALASVVKACVPGRLPIASPTQQGLQRNATSAEALALASALLNITPATLASVTGGLLQKIVELGDWNMGASSQSPPIAHGLTLSKIRGIEVIIRNDTNSLYLPINTSAGLATNDGRNNGQIVNIGGTTFGCSRLDGGYFTNGQFVNTSYNRGWAILRYLP